MTTKFGLGEVEDELIWLCGSALAVLRQGYHWRTVPRLARTCLLVLLLTACRAPAPAPQPPATPTPLVLSGVVVIEAAEQYFYPAQVTVVPGTTVVWKDVQGTHDMLAD